MAENPGYENEVIQLTETGIDGKRQDKQDAYDNTNLDTTKTPGEVPGNAGRDQDEQNNGYENDDIDPSEVQVDMEYESNGPYAGMPKEVLLQYSRQRKYIWARNILTVIVFLTTFLLLGLVIAIIAISPPCLEFWQTSPIYHIYPKSFRSVDDSNDFGDLKGIAEKLDYLNDELGVKIVALGSVYESPRIEKSDYDISDFRQIDAIYGTMTDMENLIIEVHNRGMKLVMDFVPNHSSDQHKWFLASSNTSHPDHEKYKPYYIWVPGSDETDVPNNWVAEINGGSAWTWNDDRKGFYYHSFSSEQPDLNLRNQNIRNELKDILRFWLEKGIDGFRSVGTGFMLEASHLRDNPLDNSSGTASTKNLYSDNTQNYKGVHDLVAEWRDILDEYSTEPGIYRFLETQVHGNLETTLRYYGTGLKKEADFPTNFLLTSADQDDWTATNIAKKIMDWMKNMSDGRWPNWMLSQADGSRIASRTQNEVTRCAAVISMTLPGTPSIYYGDEIGMEDSPGAGMRSPMQWSADSSGGFCGNCTPWSPPSNNYLKGVTVQNETDDEYSLLSLYKELIALRANIVFQRGYFCILESIDGVLAYVRELNGLRSAIILVNLKNQTSSPLNLTASYPAIPNVGTVEVFTKRNMSFKKGYEVPFDSTQLPPLSAIVISYASENLLSQNPMMDGKCFIHLKVCYNNALQVIQNC